MFSNRGCLRGGSFGEGLLWGRFLRH
jgi:hypothetical protein